MSEFRIAKEYDWEKEREEGRNGMSKRYWGRYKNVLGGKGRGRAKDIIGVRSEKKTRGVLPIRPRVK